MFPKDENGKIRYSDTDFTDTWKAMELLVDEGLCKAIGLSNFNRKQVDRVSAIARVPVSVLQVECNPYLTQEDLVSYCESKNIVMTAYSPLGSPARPWIKEEDPFPLKDPIVGTIAKAHNKTPAQVLIHFQLQRGLIVLAKSVTPARIKENFEVLDFELSSEEMKAISGLNRNYRGCLLEWLSDHEHHPFFKNGERTDDCK
ncbi:aldo-keto reductase family 1 member B1-like [Saccoglossus kowalevskii]|uniref:Aldose reductase-like n=1 Tax=Saccoglossus kowalevskii TaxID=10224 RepID=A0ABM0GSS6_SACKO|nr:PREDICTED: aldose reductase-like [Saccoglossus kowalevskii]